VGPECDRGAGHEQEPGSRPLFHLIVTLHLQHYAATDYHVAEAAVNGFFGGQLERYSKGVRHPLQQLHQHGCMDAFVIGYCDEDDPLARLT